MMLKFDKQAIVFSTILAAVSVLVSVVLTVISVVLSTVEPARLATNMWVAMPIAIGVPPFVAFPISYKTYIQTRLLKIANEKLSNLIRYDQLTGLLSRATFFDEVKLAQKNKPSGERYDAVFFMDLDYFKKINDRYGHAAGDEVLRRFGSVASKQMQDGDLVSRLGGEEFAAFIPNCSPEQAEDRAENLAKMFAGEVIEFNGLEIQCTVSIGVYAENRGEDLDTMLSQADELLYKAKQSGRNRVISKEASKLAA